MCYSLGLLKYASLQVYVHITAIYSPQVGIVAALFVCVAQQVGSQDF